MRCEQEDRRPEGGHREAMGKRTSGRQRISDVSCCRRVTEDGDKSVSIYLAKGKLLGTLENRFRGDVGQKTE